MAQYEIRDRFDKFAVIDNDGSVLTKVDTIESAITFVATLVRFPILILDADEPHWESFGTKAD